MTAVLFTFAAMGGALIRVVLRDRFGRPATTVVNLLGSFLIGVIVAGGFDDNLTVVVGTGFCGSLTTMSGLGVDSYDRPTPRSSIRLVGELLSGIGAVVFGFALMG
ncbi:MAG: fluoride efflux transporter FluC [Ilumatobacteraceae bacterium]